jgi:L-iditol 2-dehydrogenase
MQVARLHGIRDLRIEEVAVPEAGPGELLVKIEACGVCATDARKYEVGVNDGHYPFNPGHEWVGKIVGLGSGVEGWEVGERVYGDTYGGYSEYAVIPVKPEPWSRGPVRLPGELPLDRAIFLEPLADCLHAVHDQAALSPGQRLVVIAAGSMGLMMIAAATLIGVKVLVVEPMESRRKLAAEFGAEKVVGAQGWQAAVAKWAGEDGGAQAVILTIGDGSLVMPCVSVCRPGGRVVLFAGFGIKPEATIDLNVLHYREIALIGSEWVGTPPNQHRERYDQAADLIVSGKIPVEKLVDAQCGFSDLDGVLARRSSNTVIKTLFQPKR